MLSGAAVRRRRMRGHAALGAGMSATAASRPGAGRGGAGVRLRGRGTGECDGHGARRHDRAEHAHPDLGDRCWLSHRERHRRKRGLLAGVRHGDHRTDCGLFAGTRHRRPRGDRDLLDHMFAGWCKGRPLLLERRIGCQWCRDGVPDARCSRRPALRDGDGRGRRRRFGGDRFDGARGGGINRAAEYVDARSELPCGSTACGPDPRRGSRCRAWTAGNAQTPGGEPKLITSVTSATIAASAMASWGVALGAGGVVLVLGFLVAIELIGGAETVWWAGLRDALKVCIPPLVFVFAISVIAKAITSI